MKRILLSCIMAASCSFAMAQSQQSPAQAKAAFQAKVTELNNALTHDNADLGRSILSDLNQKMMAELSVTKMQMVNGATSAEKTAATTTQRNQATHYSHVMSLSKDNIVGHRTEIKAELDQFAATY